MEKGNKSRSNHDTNKNDRRQQYQPGAPNKSNRQSKGHEKDDSSGSEKNTTKKHGNSI
jgi:hypothetical protein